MRYTAGFARTYEVTLSEIPVYRNVRRFIPTLPGLLSAGLVVALAFCLFFNAGHRSRGLTTSALAADDREKNLDPAAWGSNHVGKELPEYLTGEECLFCHRETIGPKWQTNRHQRTVRLLLDEPAALEALKQSPELKHLATKIEFVIGGENRLRFLKRSDAYGKLDLLSSEFVPKNKTREAEFLHADKAHWNQRKFADACAGCHATAVDSKTRAFSTIGHDCYVCHGEVVDEHAEQPKLVYLAKSRKGPARVVVSICGQCHIRSGKSRSTGLPYPNNFVAGDNLFRDFEVDFSDNAIAALNPGDRHILENIRDVVVYDQKRVTCLTCHVIHDSSVKKHRRVSRSRHLCLDCHHPKGPKRIIKEYDVHSPVCGY